MEPKRENDEIEIDLGELIGLLLSRAPLIIITAILFGILAFSYAKLMITPQYRSTTSIYVINQQASDSVNTSDLQAGLLLTNDYVNMITSRSVLEKVVNSMNLDYSYGTLRGKLSVSSTSNTRIIDITVEDPDPYEAKRLADAIREAATEKILSVMAIDAINVFEEGNIAQSPSSPNVKKITLIGFAAGFLLAAALVILNYLLNDSVRTPDDVEKYLGLSTLGSIPLDEVKDEQNRKNQKLKAKAERQKKRNQKAKTLSGGSGGSSRSSSAGNSRSSSAGSSRNSGSVQHSGHSSSSGTAARTAATKTDTVKTDSVKTDSVKTGGRTAATPKADTSDVWIEKLKTVSTDGESTEKKR